MLQLALRVSAFIAQSAVRHQALHNLVRVASLADGAPNPTFNDPNVHIYIPTFSGAGGTRGKKTVRRAETAHSAPQEHPIIQLQSYALEGHITQNGPMLGLHLHGLHETLRGKLIEVEDGLRS